MTRRILTVSNNEEFISFIKVKVLTLTKLNTQVTTDFSNDHNRIIKISSSLNTDLIIIDLELADSVNLISKLRSNELSSSKKIFAVYFNELDKKQMGDIFKSGCDSIMSWNEFKAAADNLMRY